MYTPVIVAVAVAPIVGICFAMISKRFTKSWIIRGGGAFLASIAALLMVYTQSSRLLSDQSRNEAEVTASRTSEDNSNQPLSVTLDPALESVIELGKCSRDIPSYNCVLKNKTDKLFELFDNVEVVAYNESNVKVFEQPLPYKLQPNESVLVSVAGTAESFTLPPLVIRLTPRFADAVRRANRPVSD